MHWRARVVAPVVAGILGVAGGAVTAQLTAGGTAPTSTFADPLGLGVPLENLPCNSAQAVLVVGHGDGRAALDGGVANNQGDGVKYLQTADSCRTQLNAEEATSAPAFVAYLGPFDDLRQPCTMRMTEKQHATDYVARLREGNTQLVKCPCVLPNRVTPILQKEDRPTAYHNVWARSLQGMLHDEDPRAFTRKDISGTYDEFTRRYVLQKFQTPAGYLGRNGLMDRNTWAIVTRQICPMYNY